MRLDFYFVPFPELIWDDCIDLSQGEFRLLGYLIRHQVGWHESRGRHVRLTNDELLYGRKGKNGDRLDKGCGLKTRWTISQARERLAERGLISIVRNDTDKGREEIFYRLNITDRNSENHENPVFYEKTTDEKTQQNQGGQTLTPPPSSGEKTQQNQGGQTLTPPPSNTDSPPSDSDPRTYSTNNTLLLRNKGEQKNEERSARPSPRKRGSVALKPVDVQPPKEAFELARLLDAQRRALFPNSIKRNNTDILIDAKQMQMLHAFVVKAWHEEGKVDPSRQIVVDVWEHIKQLIYTLYKSTEYVYFQRSITRAYDLRKLYTRIVQQVKDIGPVQQTVPTDLFTGSLQDYSDDVFKIRFDD